jgi:hypothetical protein
MVSGWPLMGKFDGEVWFRYADLHRHRARAVRVVTPMSALGQMRPWRTRHAPSAPPLQADMIADIPVRLLRANSGPTADFAITLSANAKQFCQAR